MAIGKHGLSPDAIAGLRAQFGHARTMAPAPAPLAPAAGCDFETLPGYREMMRNRSLADLAGLPIPFFRLHDRSEGARTWIDGRACLEFSSYDYLGLRDHPAVRAAAKAAIDVHGTSTSASRLVAGERSLHAELEGAIAAHYGVDDCVVMVSGHATNVATISALVGPKDLVVHDALAHNSIVVGATLSGARRVAFRHNDLAALDDLLAANARAYERTLIVVEGNYSMDGDLADLARLIEIKRRYAAWLMVDDAHGLGVLGGAGRGSMEHCGIAARDVDIWMGTLSKTLASCGGYIAGPRALVDYLKHMAGGFVFSVGLAPPLAAAALAALDRLHAEPERVARGQANSQTLCDLMQAAGFDIGTAAGRGIIPVIVGSPITALVLSEQLLKAGINVMPILPPAVPEGRARLRFFVTSEHTPHMLAEAADALDRCAAQVDLARRQPPAGAAASPP